MKLYHGSNIVVSQPNPTYSKRNKMDFGKGFYTTTSKEQARRFTFLVVARNKGLGKKTISVYDLDVSAFSDLAIRDFRNEIDSWFDYVEKNRRQGKSDSDTFDIVIGPVADDNIQETFVLYESGVINKQEAIARLKVEVLEDQIVFKTSDSIKYLSFVEALEVE